MEQIFKTKTGFCHVFNNRIVFSKLGKAEDIKEPTPGSKNYSSGMVYFFLIIANGYFAYNAYMDGRTGSSLFFIVMGCYLFYAVRNQLKFSAMPIISADDILKIDFIKGTTFLTRSRFIIHFRDESGEEKNRLVMLPGSMMNGKEETEKAVRIFKEYGWL